LARRFGRSSATDASLASDGPAPAQRPSQKSKSFAQKPDFLLETGLAQGHVRTRPVGIGGVSIQRAGPLGGAARMLRRTLPEAGFAALISRPGLAVLDEAPWLSRGLDPRMEGDSKQERP